MKTRLSIRRFEVLLSFFLLFVFNANASEIDTTRTKKNILIGYWGTLNNNPGFRLGFEKSHEFSSKYAVNSSISLIVNWKNKTYSSAGILFNSSLRKTGKKGMFFEHGLNIGYLGSYYKFDIYRTNSNNEIINIGKKWTNSILIGYSLGLGYDFAKKTKADFQLYIKPGIYYRTPNNDNIFYLNNYSIELGLTLHPKWMNKR